jgi:hypothetical protein
VKVAHEAFAKGGLDRWMEQFAEDVDYRAVEGATTTWSDPWKGGPAGMASGLDRHVSTSSGLKRSS